MSKRSQSSTPISLFAFQDIITSVCGIMLLIVLLFAIEVSRRTEDERSKITDGEKNLQSEIDQMEQKIDAAEQENSNHIRDILEQNAGSLYAQRLGELEELKGRVKVLTVTNAALVETRNELEEELEEKEMSVQQNQNVSSVKFVQGRNSKKPLLVECTDRNIVLKGMKGKKDETFNASDREMFVEYVGNNVDKKTYCLVVMIKPSSIGYSYGLAKSIQQKGYSVGWDALEESVRLRVNR